MRSPRNSDRRSVRAVARAIALALVALAAASASGCGRRVVLAPLTGRVTFQGKPVANAEILFANAQKATYIVAKLDADGGYRVGLAEGYGLYPDTYQVAIIPPPPPFAGVYDPNAPTQPTHRPDIPVRYRTIQTSNVRMTLPPTGIVYDLDLRP